MEGPLVERYLRLLGVARRPPDLALLRAVVSAHLDRVPFENVSKLHRWRTLGLTGLPDAGLFLSGIEETGFGGTCYANNYHLHRLLGALGFDVTLCGADMASPNVHLVSLVRVEGREYLVDAGYAAPFVDPMPADLPSEHVVAWGHDRYVLAPRDGAGRRRMTLHRDGVPKHGYVVNPEPRRIEDFAGVIADSFRPEATFRNALLLARFSHERSVVIHNLSLIETDGSGTRIEKLRDRTALARAAEVRFGIPATVTEAVASELPALRDAWG